MPFLDRVIDINFYPTDEVGALQRALAAGRLGLMGLQDVFFKMCAALRLPEALDVAADPERSTSTPSRLDRDCRGSGPHEAWEETRAAQGELQFDLWGVEPDPQRSMGCGANQQHGLRNSL